LNRINGGSTKTSKKESSQQIISTPKVLTHFSNVGRVIRRNSYVGNYFAHSTKSGNLQEIINSKSDKENIPPKVKNVPPATVKLNKQLDFTSCSLLQAAHARSSEKCIVEEKPVQTYKKLVIPEEKELFSPGIEEETKDLSEEFIYCACGRICKNLTTGICEICSKENCVQEISGYLYVEKDEKNVDRYWFNLVNTDLYCIFIKNH